MTTIKLKNGSGAPTSGDLVQGEPALDLTNKRLYTEDSGGTVIEVGTNPTSVTTGDITATGTATFAGLTTTADVLFGDNDKAVFGAGSDLKLYHTGSHSYIDENGTGNLYIGSNNGAGVYIQGSGETLASFVDDGAVTLNYDNAAKLATTSTGIDVTGSVDASLDLLVGGAVAGNAGTRTINVGTAGSVAGGVQIWAGTTQTSFLQFGDDSSISANHYRGYLSYNHSTDTLALGAAGSTKVSVTSTGIDVTGTAVTDGLTVAGTAQFDNYGGTTGKGRIQFGNSGQQFIEGLDTGNGGSGAYLRFGYGSTETARFDNSGNFGIGTSTPNIANFTKALTILDSAASDQVPAIELAFGSNTRGANIAVDNRTSVKALAITAVASDLSMTFGTNNTERMRLDSSGNVQQATSVNGDLYHHIYNANTGTSTEATLYISNGPAVSSGLFAGTTGTAFTTVGGFVQDGAHIGAGAASAGGLSIMTRANAPIRFYTNGHTNERMRLDESGNLLVGTTSESTWESAAGFRTRQSGSTTITRDGNPPLYVNRLSSDGTLLQFQKGTAVVGSIGANGGRPYFASGGCGVKLGGSDFTPVTSAGATSDNVVNLGSATARFKDLYLSGFINAGNDIRMKQTNPRIDYDNGSSGSLRFFSTSANTERMRITSGGDLLVGLTSSDYLAADDGIQLNANGTARFGGSGTSARNLLSFVNGTDGTPAEVGFIQTNGSATSYSTSSDQRLKENIVDAPSASDDIDAIQVRSFDWKADGSHQKYGMVAQELQSVAPEAVSGDADSEDMMGVDYSKLVPMLVKEIQSLRARVAQLEGAN